MFTLFPGPSQVFPQMPLWLAEAYESGILSISHRSADFNALSEQTLSLLRTRLGIPADYTVFYTSSATECWELIPQSLSAQGGLHWFNGSFGEKWFDYARRLHPDSEGVSFDLNQSLDIAHLGVKPSHSWLCLTQNETSSATQIRPEVLKAIRQQYPETLIAWDCTSSLGGQNLDISQADVVFGSVQKCFGLPAGLGLFIASPRAIERAQQLGEKAHYNSVLNYLAQIRNFQTPCTPNVLGIFLLNRSLQQMPALAEVEARLQARYQAYYDILENSTRLRPLVENEEVRSLTVIAVAAQGEHLSQLKAAAKSEGFLLGNGYGAWKESSFRIANFPALSDEQVHQVLSFLRRHA